MLDKTDYYHGAAIVQLLADKRCSAIRKKELLGYVVNGDTFILLKYTTRARSPWGFSFDQEDVDRCIRMAAEHKQVILGLICGGDGICALNWRQGKGLLEDRAGRIVAARKHNHSYSVWGSAGELKRKVSVRDWPRILFEE